MKKTVLILFFISINFCAFAQQPAVEVTYKVDLLETEVSEVLKDIYKIAYENVKFIEFKLLGSTNESIFYREKLLTNDAEKGADIALTILGAKGKYFTNFQKGLVYEDLPAFGERFVIEHVIISGWQLKKEKKRIGKYECFKATTTYVVNNSKGRFEFPVVAWYTPEINLPFGPKNYSGLPGLILELQEKDRVFYADKIMLGNLDNDQLQLIVPPKGKKPISQEEFDAIGAKIAKEQFGGR
ncbi:GLPGLI family protein [Flagellimonas aequoris]|uniref:GLPGLI family protein n=1 Tax=Flagellimonas aequoris TaxID=2306997 RepID=A0A418N8A5_9FLAO|nr:GLPGLI family protein [Allomuricauda aequoris]RIV70827.1 GLPGLI family protein [Allomuricauda aequoris]TXK02266.1 GLPGLI family protein [Allomuricauda aequoris]